MDVAGTVTQISSGSRIIAYGRGRSADNYQWGTYKPQIGIYGIDRERSCRWDERGSMGRNSAGTYRQIIGATRNVDAPVAARPDLPSP